jgi:uncharacterized LabA/DUF88 family protein
MPPEPTLKRAVAFIDGQNLFFAVRQAFGYKYPNYDFPALAAAVCTSKGWGVEQTRFYTGVPDASDDSFWSYFWAGKFRTFTRQRVEVFSRSLRYRKKIVKLPSGESHAFLTAEEKGIDVRIAIDVIRLAHRKAYDVALLFSQDQDLDELCAEIRTIAKEQNRWIKIASAFPVGPTTKNKSGIANSDWIKIDRATYDSCLDSRDYRPKKAGSTSAESSRTTT